MAELDTDAIAQGQYHALREYVRRLYAPEQRTELLHSLLGEEPCRQLGILSLPRGFKLSVIIPVYNERQWIREIVRRVREVAVPKEVIIVDDCSTDGTRDILRDLEKLPDVRIFKQSVNQGKGA